jgi:amino acid transporter/mannitol/fructose-specific phosphotransferase system IIA component (Ntr-type)
VVVAYGLAALMVVPTLVSKIELATAMPRSGGSYFFIERSLGALPGMLAGMAGWLAFALKAAFAMVGIGAFAQLIWPSTDLTPEQWEWLIKAVAIGGCVVFGLMNLLSVKVAGRAQVAMVLGLLVVLVYYIAVGFPSIQQHPNFDNLFNRGWPAIFATAAMVFVSFGGLTKVAAVAEEVRRPGRAIPRAMVGAFVLVSLLYVAAVAVVVGTIEPAGLTEGPYGNLTPLSTSAGVFMGRTGVVLLSAAAILAFATTGNGAILAASRVPLAMSRDGFLPGRLQRLSRFGTPAMGIAITCGFMIVMIAGLSLSDLVKVASTMMLLLFVLINAAVLIMRGSGIQSYRPTFRSPLFPWMQIAGILLQSALVVIMAMQMQSPVPLLTAGGFFAACVGWYYVYARPRISRESALAYMMRGVVADEIGRSGLEEELREIAFERDEVVHDRFDRLVQEAAVLDVKGPAMADDVLERVADTLGERGSGPREEILAKLIEREKESSTVIRAGLAIPHIIVEGENHFDMVLVRCREGIVFGPETPTVRAAFVLAGSRDERNFHLQALMAIAHVAGEPNFDRRWREARNADQLKDVVLLSGRHRHRQRPDDSTV